MYSFSCSTVRGLHCRILRFIMRHTFSMGDRSGLQAGQSSTRTLLLRSHAVVKRAECGLALSCFYVAWMAALQNLYYLSLSAFTDVKFPMPLIPSQMLALCVHNRDPLWSGGHDVHIFQKQFEMYRQQNILGISPSQMSSGPENDGVSGCC